MASSLRRRFISAAIGWTPVFLKTCGFSEPSAPLCEPWLLPWAVTHLHRLVEIMGAKGAALLDARGHCVPNKARSSLPHLRVPE